MTSSRRAQHRFGVELAGDDLADARHALDLGEQLAGAQQRLRGHARVVGALAADELLLDQRHLEPAVGEPAGADLARRARTDHDHVELPLAHASSTVALTPASD